MNYRDIAEFTNIPHIGTDDIYTTLHSYSYNLPKLTH